MRIIPAIDIIDGKCVRLTQGDYDKKKIYNEDPLAVAQAFEKAGIQHLHLVDLDGAKAGSIQNSTILAQITAQTNLSVDFGGGVKSEADIALAFESGAQQVTCGSIAVKDKQTVVGWLKQFGADKIILGADVKNNKVAINGWTESTLLNIDDLINQYLPHGIAYIICTDISTDGMLSGPNFDLYDHLLNSFPGIKLIASGGVSNLNELRQLKEMGLEGAIVGKAIYEGNIELSNLKGI